MGDGGEVLWNPAPTVSITVEDQHGRVMCRPKELVVHQGTRAEVEPAIAPWSVRMDRQDKGTRLRGGAELWDGREWLPVTTIHNDVQAHGDAEVTVTTYLADPGYVPPRSDGSWPWGSGSYEDDLKRKIDKKQAAARAERKKDPARHVARKTDDGWACKKCGSEAVEMSVLVEFPCPVTR